MQDFHKLKVWEKAHAIALSVIKSQRISRKMNSMGSRVRLDVQVHPSRQISPKAVAVAVMQIWHSFYKSVWGLQANVNTLVKRMLTGLLKTLRTES